MSLSSPQHLRPNLRLWFAEGYLEKLVGAEQAAKFTLEQLPNMLQAARHNVEEKNQNLKKKPPKVIKLCWQQNCIVSSKLFFFIADAYQEAEG